MIVHPDLIPIQAVLETQGKNESSTAVPFCSDNDAFSRELSIQNDLGQSLYVFSFDGALIAEVKPKGEYTNAQFTGGTYARRPYGYAGARVRWSDKVLSTGPKDKGSATTYNAHIPASALTRGIARIVGCGLYICTDAYIRGDGDKIVLTKRDEIVPFTLEHNTEQLHTRSHGFFNTGGKSIFSIPCVHNPSLPRGMCRYTYRRLIRDEHDASACVNDMVYFSWEDVEADIDKVALAEDGTVIAFDAFRITEYLDKKGVDICLTYRDRADAHMEVIETAEERRLIDEKAQHFAAEHLVRIRELEEEIENFRNEALSAKHKLDEVRKSRRGWRDAAMEYAKDVDDRVIRRSTILRLVAEYAKVIGVVVGLLASICTVFFGARTIVEAWEKIILLMNLKKPPMEAATA